MQLRDIYERWAERRRNEHALGESLLKAVSPGAVVTVNEIARRERERYEAESGDSDGGEQSSIAGLGQTGFWLANGHAGS